MGSVMRSVVLIRGVIRGMGHESFCEMLAWKELFPGNPRPIYTTCSVITAPAGLPDGSYTVTFDGHVVSATRQGGLWLPNGTALPAAA